MKFNDTFYNPRTFVRGLFFLFFYLPQIKSYSQSYNFNNVYRLSSINTDNVDTIQGVGFKLLATDFDNNFYLQTGRSFASSNPLSLNISFDPDFPFFVQSRRTIVKYSFNRNLLWHKDLDPIILDLGYINISWSNTLVLSSQLDPKQRLHLIVKVSHNNVSDTLLIRFEENGDLRGIDQLSGNGNAYPRDFRIDLQGNYLFFGDGLLLKTDSNLVEQWSGPGPVSYPFNNEPGFGVNSNNEILIVRHYRNLEPLDITFPNYHMQLVSNSPSNDVNAVLIKLDANGNYLWHWVFQPSDLQCSSQPLVKAEIHKLLIDKFNNTYVLSFSSKRLALLNDTNEIVPTQGCNFKWSIVKFNNEGLYQWTKFILTNDAQYVQLYNYFITESVNGDFSFGGALRGAFYAGLDTSPPLVNYAASTTQNGLPFLERYDDDFNFVQHISALPPAAETPCDATFIGRVDDGAGTANVFGVSDCANLIFSSGIDPTSTTGNFIATYSCGGPFVTGENLSISGCLNSTGHYLWVSSPTATSFQWQVNRLDGLGYFPLSNEGIFSGVENDTLFISVLADSLVNFHFRCYIKNDSCSSLSTVKKIELLPQTSVSFEASQIDYNSFLFQANYINTDSIKWIWGNGEQSVLFDSLIYEYNANGTYLVELIGYNECGNDTFRLPVTVMNVGYDPINDSVHLHYWNERIFFSIGSDLEGELEIYDLLGKNISSIKIENDSGNHSVSHLMGGIYIAVLKTKEQQMSLKFVKD